MTEMDSAQPLPPWRSLLRAAGKREGRSAGGRWLQLASLAVDGSPRVRTLVVREWSAAATLDLLTDARSEKCLEMERTPEVELCWLFRQAREQFRLRGTAQLIAPTGDPVALHQHWNRLPPSGRSVWAWPHPGDPFDPEGSWPQELFDDSEMPEHLRLLRISLHHVEQLDLKPHPHVRRLWRSVTQWQEQRLNP